MACVAKKMDCYRTSAHLLGNGGLALVAHQDSNIVAHTGFVAMGDPSFTNQLQV